MKQGDFQPTEKNITRARELAEKSSNVHAYTSDTLTSEDIAKAAAEGTGPIWFCWTGIKSDPLYVAITGNGPTGEYNAAFFSCARELVIGLAAEVEAQRRELTVLRTVARHSLDERDTFGEEHVDHGMASAAALDRWRDEFAKPSPSGDALPKGEKR